MHNKQSNIDKLQTYYKTITAELKSTKDRVRGLINMGQRTNWGEDGRYKEAILARTIRKMLPQSFSVGSGFVFCGNEVTSQIDIIIYDNSYPLFFSEGSFVIVLPESVRGIIEVKTNLATGKEKQKLEEVIPKLAENAKLINDNTWSHQQHNGIFRGLFSFDGYSHKPKYFIKRFEKFLLDSSISTSKKDLDCLTLNENFFVDNSIQCRGVTYKLYKIPGLSYQQFIGKLIIKVVENTRGNTSVIKRTFFPALPNAEHIFERILYPETPC